MVQHGRFHIGSRGWTSLGAIFVGLGSIGIVLPLLPTTPFLLLAVGCFARGSPRAYRWLMESRRLGLYIRSYREGRGLTKRAKAISLAMLYITLSVSALVMSADALLAIILLVVAAGVSAHLLMLPTAPSRP